MEKVNILSKGKKCLGEEVKDNSGNLGIITDYFLTDGKKAKVQITYQDGTSQIREKYAVERGSFQKPFLDKTEELLKTGEWSYIPDFNNHYIINKNGEIRTCYGQYKGKILSPHLMNGYMTIALQQGETKDTRKLCRVHVLVASTFIRQIQNGEEVNHINGDRLNNSLYNLEIVSRKQNNEKFLNLFTLGFNEEEQQKLFKICEERNLNIKQYIEQLIRKDLNL